MVVGMSVFVCIGTYINIFIFGYIGICISADADTDAHTDAHTDANTDASIDESMPMLILMLISTV